MRLIKLTQGKFARVSERDYKHLSQWRWYAWKHPRTGCWYAKRNQYIGDYRHTVVDMAREILGLVRGDGVIADHRNGDTLNNTRSNLRKADRFQNQHNRGKNRNNTTGHKGAYRIRNGTYIAQIMSCGKLHYLGVFPTAADAGAAYARAAKKLNGAFARC